MQVKSIQLWMPIAAAHLTRRREDDDDDDDNDEDDDDDDDVEAIRDVGIFPKPG